MSFWRSLTFSTFVSGSTTTEATDLTEATNTTDETGEVPLLDEPQADEPSWWWKNCDNLAKLLDDMMAPTEPDPMTCYIW